MHDPDIFQAQICEQRVAQAEGAGISAEAGPDLVAMPELRARMFETLAALASWQRDLRPHTRPAARRRFRRALARRARSFHGMRLFHPALVQLRLAILWLRFLLIWPILWRLLASVAALAAAAAGARWLVDNFQQIRQLFQV